MQIESGTPSLISHPAKRRRITFSLIELAFLELYRSRVAQTVPTAASHADLSRKI